MPTALGAIVLPLALYFWNQPVRLAQMIMVTSVFDAAAAFVIGSNSIAAAFVPSLVMILLLLGRILVGRPLPILPGVTWALSPALLLALLGITTAATLPFLFAGQVMVWPQHTPMIELLRPSFGNVSQTVYLCVDMLLAVAAAALIDARPLTIRRLVDAYLISGYLAVILSLWQFVSRLTGIPYAEWFLYSNPNWQILDSQIFAGVQRVNGPFVEPSSLGFFFAGQIAACLWLAAYGHKRLRPRLLLLGSMVVVVLSTSTTGLAATALALVAFAAFALLSREAAPRRRAARLLSLLGLIGLVGLIGAAVVPRVGETLVNIVIGTLAKSESDSFVERSSMDADSLGLLLETYGLGVGWGSVRSSSLIPGLAANGGAAALVLTAWLAWRIARVLHRAWWPGRPELLAFQAFLPATGGLVAAALMSAPFLTSPTFYLLLGVMVATALRLRMAGKAVVSAAPRGSIPHR